MLIHHVLMCHILVRTTRIKELLSKEAVFVSEGWTSFLVFLHCPPVSSDSDGKSSERKILRVCHGTTADADVSLALSHQSSVLLLKFFVLPRVVTAQ